MIPINGRNTRRRSSAGPLPPNPPRRPRQVPSNAPLIRPTFLALRDHGKVYVSDLPRLSDGQLGHVLSEAREVLDSLTRRLQELEQQSLLSTMEQETRIRAGTKRDVTERFIRSVLEEQEQRRHNPAVGAAASESMSRTFMELARLRLPGPLFDSLIQETLAACEASSPETEPGPSSDDRQPISAAVEAAEEASPPPRLIPAPARTAAGELPRPASLPVVLSPDPSPSLTTG